MSIRLILNVICNYQIKANYFTCSGHRFLQIQLSQFAPFKKKKEKKERNILIHWIPLERIGGFKEISDTRISLTLVFIVFRCQG